jgi:hypothetical protein
VFVSAAVVVVGETAAAGATGETVAEGLEALVLAGAEPGTGGGGWTAAAAETSSTGVTAARARGPTSERRFMAERSGRERGPDGRGRLGGGPQPTSWGSMVVV